MKYVGNFHPSMVVKIKKHLKFNMVTSLVMELGSTVLSKSLYIQKGPNQQEHG